MVSVGVFIHVGIIRIASGSTRIPPILTSLSDGMKHSSEVKEGGISRGQCLLIASLVEVPGSLSC